MAGPDGTREPGHVPEPGGPLELGRVPHEETPWAAAVPGRVRLGGTAVHDDGCDLVWSVADGRRGRRWREACARLGRLAAARLVETDPDGRLTRLEVAAPAGLLTLHPSDDGRTLHGNVVTSAGVRHLALPWGDAHRLVVAGSIASLAAACAHLATVVPPGGATVFRGIGVDAELHVGEGSVRVERVGLTGWRASVAELGISVVAELDDRWVPRGGSIWPLEEPPGA